MNADKIETWGLGTQETFMDEVSLAKRGGSVSAQDAYLRISQLILCMAMDIYLNFDKVQSFRTAK